MQTTPCVPCCSTPITVQVPGGPGSPGNNGINSYTTVAGLGFTIPAADGVTQVTGTFANTSFMVAGMYLLITNSNNPNIFQVFSVTNATTAVLVYPTFQINSNSGASVISGTLVVPTGPQGPAGTPASPTQPITAYGSGTAFQLAGTGGGTGATAVPVVFGTNSPVITLTTGGTWLLLAKARIEAVGTTYASNHPCVISLQRTNNTPGAITNATSTANLPIVTTTTDTLAMITVPPIIYQTANTTDIISMYGLLNTATGAGTVTVAEASIVAVYLNSVT